MKELKNDDLIKNQKFDSFLNKTIIMSSKTYFKKQMDIIDKEKSIIDDEDYYDFLGEFAELNNSLSAIDKIELKLQLKDALKSLSNIEQSVISLLFEDDLTQQEVAEILKIYSKTVSKIKLRAIKKLRKSLKGDIDNEW